MVFSKTQHNQCCCVSRKQDNVFPLITANNVIGLLYSRMSCLEKLEICGGKRTALPGTSAGQCIGQLRFLVKLTQHVFHCRKLHYGNSQHSSRQGPQWFKLVKLTAFSLFSKNIWICSDPLDKPRLDTDSERIISNCIQSETCHLC